ncbi:MAG: carboxypeptidase regulatory-like domain-containing protein [Planctomycetia bacterium]|uniref:PEGA domain-containing protein n=1 Tax=Kuenenia stuttgartiensis TaxID=174633 RepID=Q1Q5Z8_KUEST|nr:carboxypeptidase regulatory-like domain-containing protein [Planctomycetia bacterium]GJQ50384.1 MAG: hypothetical protein HKUEN01_27700 [Candidatus Kuenenia stuttgartiensis]CAJ72995.1 unknown protein [Candidatus Kuenenia stuttgartiensis]
MKKLLVLMVLSLFVYSTAKITSASADIYGYVYNTDNKGLSKVKISAKDDYRAYSEESSGSGSYSLSLKVGTYTIKYEKEGYQTQTNDINLLKRENRYLEMIRMVASPEQQTLPSAPAN